MPAANWTASARPISARDAVAGGYYDLGQLVEHTDLAAATIRDALSRQASENESVPLGALARPAARIGGVASPEPMWSPDQVAEFDRRRNVQMQDRTAGQRNPDLPHVSAAEAAQRGLASVETLAAELGLAPNTLRRWSRAYREACDGRAAFPPEEAMAMREPPHHRGRQHRLRSREAVMRWVVSHLEMDNATRSDAHPVAS